MLGDIWRLESTNIGSARCFALEGESIEEAIEDKPADNRELLQDYLQQEFIIVGAIKRSPATVVNS